MSTDAVADKTYDLLSDRWSKLTFELGSGSDEITLGVRARLSILATFAKTGTPKIKGPVQGDLRRAVRILLDDKLTLFTPIGVVVAAAEGREALSDGKPVTSTQLAALGSCSQSNVRQLIKAGVLRREERAVRVGRQIDAPIRAADAKKWLASREVPGF